MIKKKVLICGICKDVESRLPFSINITEKIGAMFEDYRVVVYENDSVDKTPELLADWRTKNSRVRVRSEVTKDLKFVNTNYLKSSGTSRARNIVISMLKDYAEEFDHVVWIDMDFKSEPEYGGFVDV